MRIGIVACEVLKHEIEFLTKDDPDFVHREYLKFALHEDAKNMKKIILEKVKELEGKVDAILLGYAVCQSLENITAELNVPAVMLRGADCIEALLSPEECRAEKKKCMMTWFSSPGWAEVGRAGFIEQFHLDSVEGMDPQYFLDMMFDSYERYLFINTGVGDTEFFLKQSKDFADSIKLRLETRTCGLEGVEECVARVKKLAAGIAAGSDHK
ncbi:MAG: DUF1638 domain-containing protein [Methanomassiliicoccaceae archaeon]|nr:DUF1638 domain-containing protein [Methanomassiliicoccaceae archaeon]